MARGIDRNAFVWLVLLGSLCMILTANAQEESITNTTYDDSAQMLLDKTEHAIKSLRFVWHTQRNVIRAMGGGFLLLFGGHFTHTTLFLQSFRTAGWPVIEDGWGKLQTKYTKAREAMRKEMPTLKKTRESLPRMAAQAEETFAFLRESQQKVMALTKDVSAAQKKAAKAQKEWARFQKEKTWDLQGAQTLGNTKDEALKLLAEVQAKMTFAKAMSDKAMVKYEEAQQMYGEAMKAMNSMRAIADAVDPEHVQQIVQGMGTGVLSCVAAVKAPVAAHAVVGVDAGRILASRLLPVLHSQVERRKLPMDANAKKWLDSGVSSACSALGLYCAYKMQDAMLTVSASAMGARLVAKFFTEQVAALTGTNLAQLTVERLLTPPESRASHGKPKQPITATPGITFVGGRLAKLSAEALVETALTGASIYWQFLGGGYALDSLSERVVLGPLLLLEGYLRGAAGATAVAAAAA